MSDAAFRFYLPAYLIADIRGELEVNDPVVRLCWSLTPQSADQRISKQWGGGTVSENAVNCFDQFSVKQTAAIVAYLKWRLTQTNDMTIEQTLDFYWLNARELKKQ